MAGITVIVPAAIVAGLTASGASAGNSSSLTAMDGARTATPAHPDVGVPLTGVARHEVATLGASRVPAEPAAARQAPRRSARRAAELRAPQPAAAAAAPTPSPSSQIPGGLGPPA